MDIPCTVIVRKTAGTPQTSSKNIVTQKAFWKNDA